MVDLKPLIDCWNIYSGILLETDGRINRRMDAMNMYSQMCMMLGAKSFEIAKGVRVEPDYFPLPGAEGEMDYIMGFSLILFNKQMGRVNTLTIRGKRIFISAEFITVGFETEGLDDEEFR